MGFLRRFSGVRAGVQFSRCIWKRKNEYTIDLKKLAKATDKYSGADIESIVKEGIGNWPFLDGRADLSTERGASDQGNPSAGHGDEDKVQKYKEPLCRMKIKSLLRRLGCGLGQWALRPGTGATLAPPPVESAPLPPALSAPCPPLVLHGVCGPCFFGIPLCPTPLKPGAAAPSAIIST